jgi:hypothetical protein
MSEHTNSILLASCAPITLKKPRKLSAVRSGAGALDLVDERQVLMPSAILDFIHADRTHRGELAVRKAPLHHILYCLADLIPAGVERSGGLTPGEFSRPVGQKQHVGASQGVFANGPG